MTVEDLTPEQQQGLKDIGDKLRAIFPVKDIKVQVGHDGQDYVHALYTVVIAVKMYQNLN